MVIHLVHKLIIMKEHVAVWCCMCPGMLFQMKACKYCIKNLIATYQGAWCTLNFKSRFHEGQQWLWTEGITELTPMPPPSLNLKMISLGLTHPLQTIKEKHLHPTFQRLSSPWYRVCSSNRWPLDLDFAVQGCTHVLRVAIKSKYVRFTATGDLSTILQRNTKRLQWPSASHTSHCIAGERICTRPQAL